MTIWAILPAAGVGQRMGAPIPKQYLDLAGKPVIQHSIETLLQVSAVDSVTVALNPADTHFANLDLPGDRIRTIKGGDSRQQSVLNGLVSLESSANDDDWVLVHDAVRPCVLVQDIEKLLGEVSDHPIGGLLATPQDNTLKLSDGSNHAIETVDRSAYWQALTPQVFRYAALKHAIQKAIESNKPVTDEASAIEAQGSKPLLVEGDRNNIKLTRESDLYLADAILKLQQRAN